MTLGQAAFTQGEELNPLLYNWNWVMLISCDCSYFSGNREDPMRVPQGLPHDDVDLYFRGWYNLLATVSQLNSTKAVNGGLTAATDIMLSGCSAGGVGTHLHLDALRPYLPAGASLTGFSDSGFFVATEKYKALKKFSWENMNVTGTLHPECIADYKGEEWACIAGAVGAMYQKTPLFMVQSRYDVVQMGENAPDGCGAEPTCIREYGANLTELTDAWIKDSPQRALFLHSCWGHCSGASMSVNGTTPLKALAKWWSGGHSGGKTWEQPAMYPCKNCCDGDPESASPMLLGYHTQWV
eukprot:CAMPEP_0115513178 /NCGR_PEP_ID=MMETSP0271-20121206/74935_1 /TAXON_ID=71861 /ORGANISM="Scrippsiella trochoidea, Strain CCMP3099" /LENGTH=296 /DNA_ID=CAMNT_0002943447 /DNA_START=266 /DNA_END=1156 /DNA_ORIENTATION=+